MFDEKETMIVLTESMIIINIDDEEWSKVNMGQQIRIIA